jgi:hypothetical protein
MAKTFPIPSSPDDRAKILKNMEDISGWFTSIEEKRLLIKSTIDAVSKAYEIPKPILNKFAKAFHKDKQLKEVRDATSEFTDLADALVPPKEDE